MSFDPIEFIHTQTVIASPSIVPEIKLHLATEVTSLWQLTEERLREGNLPPPFWAFAWPGGQGLARYVLDNPDVVRGKRIIDFASGSGVAAIAAMKAGAKQVIATEIDPLALAAIQLNAAMNDVTIINEDNLDMTRVPKNVDLILAGDVCYSQAMSATLLRWLWLCIAKGIKVLLSDPGRAYVPQDGLVQHATYTVPTSRDLEDQETRTVVVSDLLLPPAHE
jgi:hypothetical protein